MDVALTNSTIGAPSAAVTALNAARSAASDAGQNVYGGNLSTLANFQVANPNVSGLNYTPGVSQKAPTTPINVNGVINPPTPVTVPNVTTPTSTTAGLTIGSIAGANNDALIQQQRDVVTASQAKVDTQQTNVQSYIDKLLGKGADQVQQETAAGIPFKTQQLNDVTNEYNTKQLQFTRQQNAILNQPGVTREGAQQALSEVSRQNNQELADIAIRQSVATGNLKVAQDLVDHKIALQYGDLKDVIGYQLKFLDQNQNTLSDAQKNVLQLQINKNQQQYDTETAKTKQLETTKLEILKNASDLSAPSSIQSAIQNATTPEAAIVAAGKYAGGLDARVKLANIAQSYAAIAASNRSNNGTERTQTLTGKPQNASQSQVNGYADRLLQGNVILNKIASNFTGNFDYGGKLPAQLQSGDRQAYEQAKVNFVTAVLRRESGASIAPTEFKSAEATYFPVAGDTPEQVTQKAATRNTVINNFYREANVVRPVAPGDVISSGGKRYKVGDDGQSLTELK